MPNFKLHTTANFVVGVPLTYYGFYSQTWIKSEYVLIAALSYGVATLLWTPDLDLRHSKVSQNWGVLRPLWWGYNRLFKHRGISHSLFFSSATRVVYLLGLGLFLFLLFHLFAAKANGADWMAAVDSAQGRFGYSLKEGCQQILDHQKELMAVGAGVLISDWVHILLDRVFTASKVTLRRRGFR